MYNLDITVDQCSNLVLNIIFSTSARLLFVLKKMKEKAIILRSCDGNHGTAAHPFDRIITIDLILISHHVDPYIRASCEIKHNRRTSLQGER